MDLATKKWYEGLKRGDQATHIYHSEPEQINVITDLIAWMMDGERLTIMSDRWEDAEDLPRSRILETAAEEGRLEVVSARHAINSTGKLKAEKLDNEIDTELMKAKEEGLESLVYVWDLDWVTRPPADFEAYMEHKSKMVLASLPNDLTVFGQYGLSSMSDVQLQRILRVSPLVLEDGQLNRNFWVLSTTSIGRPPRDNRQSIPDRVRPKAKQS